ncbi:MAG: hypothetical protein ACLFQA_00185 [Bacteroidales bacterium]
MITRSDRQIERERIRRKVAKMYMPEGTWHRVDRRNMIFVWDGLDPDKVIADFKRKNGII